MPAKITAAEEKRYARAFLFSLVSSQLCTNNASARSHAYILELFEDFDRYAWGPACLASVYRSMTRATQIKDRLRTITGPLHLLQDSSSKWSSEILVNSFVPDKGRSLTATDSNQRPHHMETSSAFLDDAKENFKHKAPAKSPSRSAR
ncbi:hypothetical protein AAC387_Pa12g0511 [Persea americana]